MGTVLAAASASWKVWIWKDPRSNNERAASNDASDARVQRDCLTPCRREEQTITCSVNQSDDSLDRRSKLIPSAGGVTPRRQETDGGQRGAGNWSVPGRARQSDDSSPASFASLTSLDDPLSLFPSIIAHCSRLSRRETESRPTRTNELNA